MTNWYDDIPGVRPSGGTAVAERPVQQSANWYDDIPGVIPGQQAAPQASPMGPAPQSGYYVFDEYDPARQRTLSALGIQEPPVVRSDDANLPHVYADGADPDKRLPRVAVDSMTTISKGLVGAGQAAVGLADLVAPDVQTPAMKRLAEETGAPQGSMLRSAAKTLAAEQEALKYSTETRQAHANVREAKGFFNKIGAALNNPSVIATTVGESIPTMLAGGAIGKGVGALGKVGSLLSKYGFAAGESAMAAGSIQANTLADSPTGETTLGQKGAAVGGGVLTGLISVLGGKVASKLGIDDIDKLLAGNVTKEVKQNVITRALAKALASEKFAARAAGTAAKVGMGAAQEGLEELAQSTQEQIAGNLAQGKPWYDGLDQAAVMGMLSGGVMGGGTQLRPVSRTQGRAMGMPEEVVRKNADTRTEWVKENADQVATNVSRARDRGIITPQQADDLLSGIHPYLQTQPTQEPTNAIQEPPATPPDASSSPRVEAQVPKRPEPKRSKPLPDSGQGGGQVSGTETQAEVAPQAAPTPATEATPGDTITVPKRTVRMNRNAHLELLDTARQSFLSSAVPGAEFTSSKYPGTLRVLPDGTISIDEGKGARRSFGSVEKWAKGYFSETNQNASVTWLTPQQPTGETIAPPPTPAEAGVDSQPLPPPPSAAPIPQYNPSGITEWYHASPVPVEKLLREGLRPGMGTYVGEQEGVYFAETPEEAKLSTGHRPNATVTQWRVHPRKVLVLGSPEWERISELTSQRALGQPGAKEAFANANVTHPEDQLDFLGHISGVQGAEDIQHPNRIFTQVAREAGYDAVERVTKDSKKRWLIALDPSIITESTPPQPQKKPLKKAAELKTGERILPTAKELKQGKPLKTGTPIEDKPDTLSEADVVREPPAGGAGGVAAQGSSSAVGMTHAINDDLRLKMAWQARQDTATIPNADTMDKALKATPAEVDAALAKLTAGGAPTVDDNALVLRRRVELGNALNAAVAQGDTAAQQRLNQELAAWTTAADTGGTTEGRAFQFRQEMANPDGSLAGRVIAATRAKGTGKPLTDEEFAAVKSAHEAVEAANAELAGLAEVAAEKRAEGAINQLVREAQTSKKNAKRRQQYHTAIERLYDTANRWGVDPKTLREAAEHASDTTSESNEQYNAALSAAAVQFMTKAKMESIREAGGDPATQIGVDVAASNIATDPDFTALGLRADPLQELIAKIDAGPVNTPPWHDTKNLEDAAKMLWDAKLARGELSEAAEPPSERPAEQPKEKAARKSQPAKSQAERKASAWQNLADGARARLKDIKLTSGLDPQIAADLAIVGADLIQRGARQAAVWTARMVAEFGEAVRKHLPVVWKASQERLRTFETEFHKGSPEERIEKQTKFLNNRLKKKGVLSAKAVEKLARAVIDSGVHGTKEVAAEVHKILQGIQPDITPRETHDLISNRGDVKVSKDDPTSRELTSIKRQLATIENIAGLKQTPPEEPLGRGYKRQETNDAERLLQEEYNREKKLHPEIFAKTDNQLQGALQSAEKSILRRIEDAQREIGQRKELGNVRERIEALRQLPADQQRVALLAELERQVKHLDDSLARKRPVPLSSPKLEAGRDKLALLRAHIDELRQSDPQFQADDYQRWLAMRKRQLATRLDDIRTRTAEMERTGKIVPKKPIRKRDLDMEGLTLRMEVEEAKAKETVLAESIRRKNLEWGPWLWEGLGEIANLFPRTLMLGLDLSTVLLQGGIYTASHPFKATRNILGALHSIIDKRIALAKYENLQERANWQNGDYAKAKIEFTQSTGAMSDMEELYQSRILRWLADSKSKPLLPISLAARAYMATERGVRTFNNGMRADLFDIQKHDTMAIRNWFETHGIAKPKPWAEQDAKTAGRTANILSGRGVGSNFNGWTNWLLLAPRWALSRFQTDFVLPFQAVTPNFIGRWNADYAMRLAYAKLGVQAIVGMAAVAMARYWYYWLMAGDDEDKKPTFEWDIRSGDALTTKVGNTRIESMGGLRQPLILASRVLSGTTKTKKGEIRSIRATAEDPLKFGQDDAADAMFTYARGKLGVVPSAFFDWSAGTDVTGETVTATDIVTRRLTPVNARDIYAAEKELGAVRGTTAAIEAWFGARVNTYEPREKPAKPFKFKKSKPLY